MNWYTYHLDKSGHPKCLNPAPDLSLPVILHNEWEIEDKNSTKALNGFLKMYSDFLIFMQKTNKYLYFAG